MFASAELVLWSPGYATDERSSLGRNGLALPAADAARPFRVQRSVCNAAAPSARRTPGTAKGHPPAFLLAKTISSAFLRLWGEIVTPMIWEVAPW